MEIKFFDAISLSFIWNQFHTFSLLKLIYPSSITETLQQLSSALKYERNDVVSCIIVGQVFYICRTYKALG
jgi:hypothetical protein